MSIKKTVITQKVLVASSPIDVYHAFIDPKKHSDFTGSMATGEPFIGSRFTAWDGYIQGKILELEKGKRIVQEWITTEWPKNASPSILELTFRSVDDKTEITMVHSNVPENLKADLAQGWNDFYWEPLQTYFEKQT